LEEDILNSSIQYAIKKLPKTNENHLINLFHVSKPNRGNIMEFAE